MNKYPHKIYAYQKVSWALALNKMLKKMIFINILATIFININSYLTKYK